MGIGLNIQKEEDKSIKLFIKDEGFPKVFDDGAFTVDHEVNGYQSYSRDGEKIIFSGSEWECEQWTRQWMKAQQEGWPDYQNRVVNSGVVGGKL